MKFIGYAIAIIAGWFSWQFLMVVGFNVQRDDGPFVLQILFTWLCLPLGMAVAALIAWAWFQLVPDSDKRSAASHAQAAGVFACLAAMTSCGWFASSTQDNPPEALFFPLINAHDSR